MEPVGGDAHCEYNSITATPWLSMLKAMCTLSGLFTRNTVVQEATRNLPDHLNAAIPGQGVSRLRLPMDLATSMLEAERRLMHAEWSKAGRAMLGQ
eukprot:722999-Pyramimonas_sp.AAC.1